MKQKGEEPQEICVCNSIFGEEEDNRKNLLEITFRSWMMFLSRLLNLFVCLSRTILILLMYPLTDLVLMPCVTSSHRRKSISGSWKANIGSSVLEQIPITDRYKKWMDEVSAIFGGLDIVVLEAVADREGREIIYEVSGSWMTLMGETQEEDRKLIADLLCNKMSTALA